jgi:hypothetical protein
MTDPHTIPILRLVHEGDGYRVWELTRTANFVEMLAEALGVSPDVNTISASLISGKRAWPFDHAMALIGRQRDGEDVGFATDGSTNHIPVEEDGTVPSVIAYCHIRPWRYFDDLLDDDEQWPAGNRLTLRNAGPSAT